MQERSINAKLHESLNKIFTRELLAELKKKKIHMS